jgi:hypothetical protein
MNDTLSTILVAIITSSAVTAILSSFLKSKEIGDQRRWEIKREACLEALEIIDARFADYDWKINGESAKVDKQDFIPTAKIRSCFNRLALACNDSNVPQLFEKCLNLRVDDNDSEPLNINTVVSLRNAIRKELGFGKDLATKVSWIMFINWKHPNKK